MTALRKVFPEMPTSKSTLIDSILCLKNGEFHDLNCIHMKCVSCGPDRLQAILNNANSKDAIVECQEWVNIKIETVTKKILETKQWPVQDLLQKLIGDLKSYPLHLFTAKWQYKHFNFMKNHVKRGEVVKVYDFAENFRTTFQDEVQSAHWTYTQVTLHPVVCYYRCKCEEILTHSVVVVSDDRSHDCFAVDAMLQQVDNFFDERGLQFSKSVEWSDGCMAQYKSKGPFWLLQRRGSSQIIHRHYFGSRHGKNPSDGESAIVKSAVARAVKCRRAIFQNADDLFAFAVSNLTKDDPEVCQHFKRSFVFVKSADIKRRKLPSMAALHGTRLVHSIISDNGQELRHRNLSCSYKSCSDGGNCEDNGYVEDWKCHSFPVVKEMAAVLDKSIDDGLDVLSRSTLEYLESLDKDITEESHQPQATDEQFQPQAADTSQGEVTSIMESLSSLSTEEKPQPQTPTVETPQEADKSESATKISGGPLLQEGHYVEALVYDIHGARHTFRGIVEKVLQGEISIRFMKCLGGGVYVWPNIDDIALVPIYDICRVLNAPSLFARGRYKFE